MSAPVQHDKPLDDARLYAPPWARERPLPAVAQPQLISSPPVASALEEIATAVEEQKQRAAQHAARLPMGVGGPNIEWTPKFPNGPEFEGDVAMRTLRRRLTLEPDVVPEPPLRAREARLPWMARLGFVFLAAALVAFGVVVITTPEMSRTGPLKGDRLVAAAAPGPVARHEDPARLLVEVSQVEANQPLPLGLSLQGAVGNEVVLLTGLATGTRLTAGAPFGNKGWRIAARDLGAVFAYAPKDYVGVMDTAIHLRSAGNALLDSKLIRLEWTPKEMPQTAPRVQSPLFQLDPDEIANLIARGQQYFRNGDIASARLMFRRAAEAGSAQAAVAMGATFDPPVLRRMGVLGFAPDAEQARAWYQKAADRGASEAPRLIERLQTTQRQ